MPQRSLQSAKTLLQEFDPTLRLAVPLAFAELAWMFMGVVDTIINFIGDWALIYGHLGLPAMGIVGSGWSTCFARIYLLVVLLITLTWIESKRKLESWKGAFRLELKRMVELLRLGIPAATQI